MNPTYFGDSYDVVKRFFCDMARAAGYVVYIDPMFTEVWTPQQRASFLRAGQSNWRRFTLGVGFLSQVRLFGHLKLRASRQREQIGTHPPCEHDAWSFHTGACDAYGVTRR